MRIPSKKPFYKRKKAIFAIVLAIIISVGAGVFALNNHNNKEDGSSSENIKPERTKKKENTKQEAVTSESEQEKDAIRVSNDTTSSSDSAETPNFTSAQQVGDYIRVSAIFSQPSSGKCILKFEQSGQTKLQKEAPIVVGPSYYVCNGFRVPVSELPSKGKWNIIVIHELNGKTARASKELNVQ